MSLLRCLISVLPNGNENLLNRFKIGKFTRQRHRTWLYGDELYIYGGLPATDNRTDPTSSLVDKISISKILEKFPALMPQQVIQEDKRIKKRPSNQRQRKDKTYNLAEVAIVATMDNYEAKGMIEFCPIHELQEESRKLDGTGLQAPQQKSVQDNRVSYRNHLASLVLDQMFIVNKTSFPGNEKFTLEVDIIKKICTEVIELMQETDSVLYLRPPIKIFGNLYGQLGDLLRLFREHKSPLENKDYECDIEGVDYVFLGNYVDRGVYSLEVVCLLFALKLKHPEQVHLLRGSHEDSEVNREHGFGNECLTRIGEDIDSPGSIFKAINAVFEHLPLAAIIGDKILCVHSGIGENLHSIEEIENIERPIKVSYDPKTPEESILLDLLWSDPALSDSTLDSRVLEYHLTL